MEIVSLWLIHILSFYLTITTTIVQCITNILRFPSLVSLLDVFISLYFRFCGLVSCTLDIDDQTSMHFWAPIHREFNKPNLLLIHGYGSDPKWQFFFQVGPLARAFNVYAPDLVFFGKSYTNRPDRSEVFQAKCIAEGMKRLGVTHYSLFGISYGGFVGYSVAEMYPEVVEKIVIASSGIGCSEQQKVEQLTAFGTDLPDLLLPQTPKDLRKLIKMTFSKRDPFKWVPDFVLRQMIHALGMDNRKEKKELVEHLLAGEGCSNLPNIRQETLLLWGEKDKVFPLAFGCQLQRKLGPKAKIEILKNTGHALNIESADQLNGHIKEFISNS